MEAKDVFEGTQGRCPLPLGGWEARPSSSEPPTGQGRGPPGLFPSVREGVLVAGPSPTELQGCLGDLGLAPALLQYPDRGSPGANLDPNQARERAAPTVASGHQGRGGRPARGAPALPPPSPLRSPLPRSSPPLPRSPPGAGPLLPRAPAPPRPHKGPSPWQPRGPQHSAERGPGAIEPRRRTCRYGDAVRGPRGGRLGGRVAGRAAPPWPGALGTQGDSGRCRPAEGDSGLCRRLCVGPSGAGPLPPHALPGGGRGLRSPRQRARRSQGAPAGRRGPSRRPRPSGAPRTPWGSQSSPPAHAPAPLASEIGAGGGDGLRCARAPGLHRLPTPALVPRRRPRRSRGFLPGKLGSGRASAPRTPGAL